MSILDELKRRSVLRVATAYVVMSWVVAQVLDLVLENIGAPTWVMQTALIALFLGFFIALIISWVYELTPEGIKRDEDIPHDGSAARQTVKRLDIVTILLLVVAIGIVFFDRLAEEPGQFQSNAIPETELSVTSESIPSQPLDQSIAVLPFVSFSSDPNDSYIGKGIAEELLNALAQIPELKVAARTSAFSLADNNTDLRSVGEILDVAHVLEGSVRRSGDRLRITAQLIRAEDGFHLWSGTYENRIADIFDIQDEIVAELSRVLQIRLGVGAGAGRNIDSTMNSQAYELYLQALDLWWTRENGVNRSTALQTFWRVTELAPNFSDGWAAYAEALSLSDVSFVSHLAPGRIPDEIESSFARALELNPNNPRALAGLVYYHTNRQIDIAAANEYLERALIAAPSYGFTNYAAAQFYFSVGDELQATNALNRAIGADPINMTLRRIKFQYDAAFGRFDAASPYLEGLTDCVQSACLVEHWQKALFVIISALHAASERDLVSFRDDFDDIYQTLSTPPESLSGTHRLLMAYANSILQEGEPFEYWSNTDFLAIEPVGTFALDASILAQQGLDDQALDILERVSADERFFASRGVVYVLWPGRIQMPDHIREHPRYDEIWSLPGMPEIALARMSNQQPAGLPLYTNNPD